MKICPGYHASRHAAEWAESPPISTSERFDKYLTEVSKVTDLRRLRHFGPMAGEIAADLGLGQVFYSSDRR